MGIRETIGKKQSITGVVAVVAIIGAVAAIIVQARGMGPSVTGTIYITDDDGKTFTAAKPKDMIGIGKDGQPVARAHVFVCGGKQVVGYMTRYTQDSVKLLMEVQADKDVAKSPEKAAKLSQVPLRGMELKRPGQAKWVPQSEAARAKIRPFVCPDGTRPAEVLP